MTKESEAKISALLHQKYTSFVGWGICPRGGDQIEGNGIFNVDHAWQLANHFVEHGIWTMNDKFPWFYPVTIGHVIHIITSKEGLAIDRESYDYLLKGLRADSGESPKIADALEKNYPFPDDCEVLTLERIPDEPSPAKHGPAKDMTDGSGKTNHMSLFRRIGKHWKN